MTTATYHAKTFLRVTHRRLVAWWGTTYKSWDDPPSKWDDHPSVWPGIWTTWWFFWLFSGASVSWGASPSVNNQKKARASPPSSDLYNIAIAEKYHHVQAEIPSLKLTVRTWKRMVGILLSFWVSAYFQGQTVSFGEEIHRLKSGEFSSQSPEDPVTFSQVIAALQVSWRDVTWEWRCDIHAIRGSQVVFFRYLVGTKIRKTIYFFNES